MSKLCNICGCEIPEGEEHEMDGQVLCHEHYDELYTTCDHCGQIVRRDQCETVGRDTVCNECLENSGDFVQCEDCGSWVRDYDVRTVNIGRADEGVVCEDCLDNYYWCDSCETYVSADHVWGNDGNTVICDDCSDNYYICSNCGDIIHEDYTYWSEGEWGEGDPLCRDCAEHARPRAIHDYGYKPRAIFGTTDANTDGLDTYNGADLTFGVELECDGGDDPNHAATEVQALTDRLYCKHDGSLDRGYEIVTHPGTLAWHMNSFPWAKVCNVSIANGFKSHDAGTCGLHIHIGRAQLGGDAAVAKLVALTDVLWPELVRFSRRGGESRWANRNNCLDYLTQMKPMSEEEACYGILRDSQYKGRYLAVNLQNRYTVELRFNRGTLKLNTIYACLQLASNLSKYAMEHTLDECLDAKWDDVVHSYEYDELTSYVNSRFVGWAADFRPTTTYRVKNAQSTVIPNEDPFSFESRNNFVLSGATYYADGTEPMEGNLVVYMGEGSTYGPRTGSIGVCIATQNDGWNLYMWNDTEATGLHNGDRGLPARCYYLPTHDIRVVETLRGGTSPCNVCNRTIARDHGLILGDLVRVRSDYGEANSGMVGILYGFDHNGTGYVAWRGLTHGHNGDNETLRFTPYRNGGWNYGLYDLELA